MNEKEDVGNGLRGKEEVWVEVWVSSFRNLKKRRRRKEDRL